MHLPTIFVLDDLETKCVAHFKVNYINKALFSAVDAGVFETIDVNNMLGYLLVEIFNKL